MQTCGEHVPLAKRAHVCLEARPICGVAPSREAAKSPALHPLMKFTFTTFLFITLQFVLAHSSATTFALYVDCKLVESY